MKCDGYKQHAADNGATDWHLMWGEFGREKSNTCFYIDRSLGNNYDVAYALFLDNATADVVRVNRGSDWSKGAQAWGVSRIQGYAGIKGIIYTRYADDITLSALNESKIRKAKSMIEEIVVDEGFLINHKKTKICGTRKRKDVTGLVISKDSVGIGRKKYRKMRTENYTMLKSEPDKLPKVNGWLAFIKSVDLNNYYRLKKYILTLKKVFPESDMFKLIPSIQKNSLPK